MDELDRILGEDEGLEPSSGLTRRVMESLEQDRRTPPPIPFPWLRVLPALVGALGIVVAFAVYFAAKPLGPATALEVGTWPDHPLAAPLGWAALSLVGSWAVFRLSMRLAAPTR
ncbi:MAG: hypothetical protein GY716_12560 [bacterium]|nr:hypothetical protein [bacterium]